MSAGTFPGVLMLAAAIAVVGGPESSCAQERVSAEGSPTSFKPYVSWSGRFSHVTERSLYRIRSEREWQELWLRHLGRMPKANRPDRPPPVYHHLEIPKIDFAACEVLAVFRGSRKNGPFGVSVHSLVEQNDRILVHLQDRVRQRGSRARAVETSHYGIFVLPRSSKSLVLLENKQQYLGQPPVWQESERLETADHTDGTDAPALSDKPSQAEQVK